MSAHQLKTNDVASREAPSAAPSVSSGAGVQFKKDLAGHKYVQQREMVRPPSEGTDSGSAAESGDGAPVQMSGGGTPGNNQAQNKQFKDACREIGRQLGAPLTKDQKTQLHRAISGENLGYHEIVEEGLAMFGG